MKRNLIVVVDYGTSNVRVNAIDTDNGEIAYSYAKKYLVKEKGKGYAEISAEHLWTYSEECMKEVMQQICHEDEPRAIAFSFFGDNLLAVDENGNALTDCILCTDPRGTEEIRYINEKIPPEEQKSIIGDWYSHHLKVGAKILWIKNNLPEIAEKTVYWDSQQQYIFRKLGLRGALDYTMAARKQLLDMQSLEWSGRFLETLGITSKFLGTDVIASGDIVGMIDAYGSVKFKAPLPVIAGAHDCDVGMIGMGLLDDRLDFVGDITGTYDHVGYLTRRVVNLAVEHPELPLGSYNGPLKDSTICLGAFPTAGATLEWFMRDIHEGTGPADYRRYWDHVKFDGQGTVMVHPTLDSNRGKVEGIGVGTTKEDLFRAVIEAITFENRRLIEDCEKGKQGELRHVRIGGGAANSDEWLQLRADISGKTIDRMKNIQVSSVGAAVLAATQVGIFATLEDAVEHMVHVQDVFTPRKEVYQKYEKKYCEYLDRMGYK